MTEQLFQWAAKVYRFLVKVVGHRLGNSLHAQDSESTYVVTDKTKGDYVYANRRFYYDQRGNLLDGDFGPGGYRSRAYLESCGEWPRTPPEPVYENDMTGDGSEYDA